LYTHFLEEHNYPILILYEGYSEYDIDVIKNKFINITFIFEEISITIPDYLDTDVVYSNIEKKPVNHWRNIGYRHMCRFFAVDMFFHPIISTYKYVMRIDDDSIIKTRISTDFFDYMDSHNIDYMYRVKQTRDCNICNAGMIDFFRSIGYDYDYNNKDIIPFNNFHIFKLSSIKDRDIFTHKEEIIKNIYYHRWGDAPLHGAYITMYNLKSLCTEEDELLSFEYEKWGRIFNKGKYIIW
jgi:hypothetical protein